jgi:hypothetical protein
MRHLIMRLASDASALWLHFAVTIRHYHVPYRAAILLATMQALILFRLASIIILSELLR